MYAINAHRYTFRGDFFVRITCLSLLKSDLLYRENIALLSEGIAFAGKQTESHRSCFPCKNGRKSTKYSHRDEVPVSILTFLGPQIWLCLIVIIMYLHLSAHPSVYLTVYPQLFLMAMFWVPFGLC